ncbi:Unknown protein [Arabidopsis thaliana]|uniref:F11A6.2 protein n=1 Tax=Arabidopsis thaliana TaxID=3702 RepID=Q9FZ65_ARATH|nr:Unknown protein [Arabidopsis thaliana]
MEDKGKGVVEGDEGNLISELEEGPSNMECDKQVLGGDTNYDDKDLNSDEEGLVDDDDDDSDDDDEGDESEEEDDFEAGSVPNTFERPEYEALAERKRKALADSQRNPSNISNSTSGVEGFMEFMSSGRRRKSRKYKKKGRRPGSKKEVAPDILKRFREALFLHAHGRDIEALPILVEVIKQAPAFDIAYYYLSRVSEQLGKTESSSTEALKIAANIKGSKSPFWKLLYERFKEQENISVARSYASKAIQADPDDIPLKYEYADICLNTGKYREAAETFEQIFRRCPERIEALKWGVQYFLKSGEGERAASILEDHIKSHSSEVGHDVLDLLASVFMKINAHDRALKYIHDVRQIYNVGKELSSSLKIRQAICHVHLEEMEQAESVLSILPQEAVSEHPELITNLADELTNIGNFHSALKYYIEAISEPVNGNLFVKIARCYMSLEERKQAIVFYYKALNELSDTVDVRITLASLLLEDGKRDEAVLVLSPPENPEAVHCFIKQYFDSFDAKFCDNVDPDTAKLKAWWKNRKIRMNLCQIYHSEGMLEDFANTALQLVLKSRGKENDWFFQSIKETKNADVLEMLKLPKISCDTMDPKQWFDCVRSVIQQHPYRLNAWNCYYSVISRLGKRASTEAKFMHHLRSKYRDCVPPILIAGHHFTVTSRHQDAAREYLEAYKLMPESPLINLCVGAALINLALGFRLKNRHECLAQGFAFLYNNLRICSNSQEALYNVARAYQHVGLVTLAASYYEKVLAIYEKDYTMPKLPNEDPIVAEERKPVNCDLRKEAAHNLHLIYKHSGAFDLARQVLKDHCTF